MGLRRVEQIMGTAISLEIAGTVPDDEAARLADEVYAWMRLVDDTFSTYKENSEVSRLHAGQLTASGAGEDLRHVLAVCADLWAETDGYFDVYATGRLDPSGYVKGWAVQVASDRLMAAGATDHSLNAGGDVRVHGHTPTGRPWRIGVRHPWDPAAVCFVLAGSDLGIATSGTYERGQHVIDPRGGGAASGLRSVTVTGPDLGRADAFATAAVAMGAAGLDWLATLPDGYESAVVTDDGRFFRSEGLPEHAG
ncbi:FAD:protein FMN transferase [Virgisporangium ochraceum]